MQGLGAASLVPNAPALLSHAYPMKEGAGGGGNLGSGRQRALISGPLIGGGLIALVGWRSIFLLNLPMAKARGF
jgi:MFS transporter, DHA2 family, methylenomycin A resistance protein